jgi:hypothetical protein
MVLAAGFTVGDNGIYSVNNATLGLLGHAKQVHALVAV